MIKPLCNPNHIQELKEEYDHLRVDKNYIDADKIRNKFIESGLIVRNFKNRSIIEEKYNYIDIKKRTGLIAIIGSGEVGYYGRKIHEYLIKPFKVPVKIVLLETPAGYENNPHLWYLKMEERLYTGLKNYKPIINRISALRRDGSWSTNNSKLINPIIHADYIHLGAGSPSYAVKHLKNSLAYKYINKSVTQGKSLSFASAASIAFGQFALPVYEIYFAGIDPFWINGLNFFNYWNLNLTFIPHWNNQEGGNSIDTRFSYMGEHRFNILLNLLPSKTTVIGIDEHTGLIFDFSQNQIRIMGKGDVHVLKNKKERILKTGQDYNISIL